MSKIVLQYDLNNYFIKEYHSVTHAARCTNLSQGNISSVCLNRKSWDTAGGFIWKYKNKSL